jgi:hypothetical protein
MLVTMTLNLQQFNSMTLWSTTIMSGPPQWFPLARSPHPLRNLHHPPCWMMVESRRDGVFSGIDKNIDSTMNQTTLLKLRSSGKYSLAWHQLDNSRFLSTSTLLGAKLTNWSRNGLKLASEKKWRPTLNRMYTHSQTACEHKICQHVGDV